LKVALSPIRGIPEPADAVEPVFCRMPGPASGMPEAFSGIVSPIYRMMAPACG